MIRIRATAIGLAFSLLALCLDAVRVLAQTSGLPAEGLVAHYAMAGNAVDSSGTGNDGTVVGKVNAIAGPVGQGLYFDGSSYIQAAADSLPSGDGARTLALWARLDEMTTEEALFAGYGQFGSYNQVFVLGAVRRGTQLSLFFSQWGSGIGCSACPDIPGVSPVVLGRWYHVAVTSVKGVTTLYLDGVPVQSRDLSVSTAARTSFYLGGLPGVLGTTRRFTGALDEVRVYDRVLSAAEVQQFFAHGQTPGGAAEPDSATSGTATPVLLVSPKQLQLDGVPRGTALSLTNGGTGTLDWAVSETTDWLSVRGPTGSTDQGSLYGSGPTSLTLRTTGVGLAPGFYEAIVRIRSNGGDAELIVQMVVANIPEQSGEGDAPQGTWSTPFAVPVAEVLSVPLDQVLSTLSAQAKVSLTSIRVVAVTINRAVYVAGESPYNDAPSGENRVETRVWRSDDQGSTWRLLVTSQPRSRCSYDARFYAAALHPDGQRVFLACSEVIYLDERGISRPPEVRGATALHVSPDGRYLYVAMQDLDVACNWEIPNRQRVSYAGVYRMSLGASPVWEAVTDEHVAYIQPVTRIGSDPADDAVVYYGNADVVYRVRMVSANELGWRRVAAADVPDYVTETGPLAAPQDLLRVPPSYAAGWAPHNNIDLRYSWAGYLFGYEGVVYSKFTAELTHMPFTEILGSRDAGVSWSGGVTVSEPGGADALGSLSIPNFGVTGGVGPWNVDPVDPMTIYTTVGGRDLVYQSRDHGANWTALGQGLPATPAISGLGVDSLGTLYIWARTDSVYARRVAQRVARIGAITATPVVGRDDTVRVTARVDPWPDPGVDLPAALQVSGMLEPEFGSWGQPLRTLALRDDGVAPDSVAGDRVWSGLLPIEVGRPYGTYGVVVAAALPDSPATRSSRRANYQVVPEGAYPVYYDAPATGWRCEGSSVDLLSGTHVHGGATAILLKGEITCTWEGEPIAPYARQLQLWAYRESGTEALRINNLTQPGQAPTVSPGQWVQLSLPAEALVDGPAVITALRFLTTTPVWLDDIVLTSALPEVPGEGPTAITAPTAATLPAAIALLPSYPNPFNPSTCIRYQLATTADVRLSVYAVTGQFVRELAIARQEAGSYQVTWDGRDASGAPVGSGVYLCRLQTGDLQAVTRMALAK